ncbi:MAG: glycosyltransferase [Lutibacter sp. BRH_c52]|nr:MAG: glycosyltransferase [Lutibacter sp. BRH_c52]
MNKKLSIITINFNNFEGLKRTVESVVNQTWQEFEYIVIDGGSTDGSAEYLQSQSEHINYWVSEPDNGIYNAMNKGIARAAGQYLLFLNSGDHFYKNKILEQNHIFLNEKDLIYFNLNFVDKTNSRVGNYPEHLLFSHFINDTLPHPATFIKSSLFKRVGLYDESLNIVSDWKFFILALFKYNCTYKKFDEVLATYYLDGISSNLINQKMIYEERKSVLNSEFKGYIDDITQLLELRTIVFNLRKSKKIGLLVKLGLIHKF